MGWNEREMFPTEVDFRSVGFHLHPKVAEIFDNLALLRNAGAQLPPHILQLAPQVLHLRRLVRLEAGVGSRLLLVVAIPIEGNPRCVSVPGLGRGVEFLVCKGVPRSVPVPGWRRGIDLLGLLKNG
jgi:hypothetical protein